MSETSLIRAIRQFGKKNRLVVCSNRGPFTLSMENGQLKQKRSGGGLVSALISLKDLGITWYAAAQNDVERDVGAKGLQLGNLEVKFVDIPYYEYQTYYNKISNRILWYTQHGLWNTVYDPSFGVDIYSDWKVFCKVNKRFANAIAEELERKNQNYVMVQDYHLYLVPYYLRTLAPKTVISHFSHIPWPPAESWQVLPDFITKDIVESLVNADIAAFHCQQYANNFFATVQKVTDLEGNEKQMFFSMPDRKVSVMHFPISVDYQELLELRDKKDFKVSAREIINRSEEKIIVRVDRADLSKNIFRGFMAFDKLLEKRKDLRRKVTFVAMLYETRSGLSEYADYLKNIKQLVKKINHKYGNVNWEPIHLRVADNYIQSIAALNVYDVLLVNPVADGMNLVAKEGPIVNSKDGVLVLSKFCGAFNELGGFCLGINPFDIAQTTAALEKGLDMGLETKRLKAKCLRSIIKHNNSQKWLYYNIKAIKEADNVKVASVTC